MKLGSNRCQRTHIVLGPRGSHPHEFKALGAGGTGIEPATCGFGAHLLVSRHVQHCSISRENKPLESRNVQTCPGAVVWVGVAVGVVTSPRYSRDWLITRRPCCVRTRPCTSIGAQIFQHLRFTLSVLFHLFPRRLATRLASPHKRAVSHTAIPRCPLGRRSSLLDLVRTASSDTDHWLVIL